ncbi:MAG: PHP domain-containing protein [Bacteroidota bacterium]|jgi:predicted metal-dependent phosphoesterase TrpH
MEWWEVPSDGKADLHTHTTFSDGALTPAQLVKKAKQAGLAAISITDHDSVNGLDEAIAAGKDLDVAVVPGVELSATFNRKEVHILGYFVDHDDKQFQIFLSELRGERIRRAERIVQRLNQMNIPITMNSVLKQAGDGAVGRPHIAAAMVTEGLAPSYQSVFDDYIGNGRPAYERKAEVSPEKTVHLIADAGGLSFLAHPGRSLDDNEVHQLVKAGIDGIEVVHPSHSPWTLQHFHDITSEYFLLECGGSDFHGGLRGDDDLFGQVTITAATVEIMRRRLFSHH